MSFGEEGTAVVKEEMVLEKFDGEGDDAVLRERISLVDGAIVNHEFFDEEGNLVDAGGEHIGTN